ncbi:hypothetical protein [Mastigocoleus testarum]|uniref:Uncharacterized protein n=1 Tax=Mastigocoleus testarum BC008 TaxID=371196 RepID=A0A0V7ZZ19_9CYAN|nr:hypothetical protein [Mastigocoleus testarum]KST67556.1 hypothetical protein BC008_30640 [Mastigocoleus testarum BC008]KST69808.1 hypothetical protein BC008_36210 [Mastigocoleus testarum BC008]
MQNFGHLFVAFADLPKNYLTTTTGANDFSKAWYIRIASIEDKGKFWQKFAKKSKNASLEGNLFQIIF